MPQLPDDIWKHIYDVDMSKGEYLVDVWPVVINQATHEFINDFWRELVEVSSHPDFEGW